MGKSTIGSKNSVSWTFRGKPSNGWRKHLLHLLLSLEVKVVKMDEIFLMGIELEMKRTIKLFSLSICLFSSCAMRQPQSRSNWINAYKNQVIISCIKESSNQPSVNDISESINFDIIGDTRAVDEADSLGQLFYRTIEPSMISDHQNKKAVYNLCLAYYQSKELDVSAKKAYKTYMNQ